MGWQTSIRSGLCLIFPIVRTSRYQKVISRRNLRYIIFCTRAPQLTGCGTAAAHHNETSIIHTCFIIKCSKLSLSLFVFWVVTDNSDFPFSFNDFAFFANWFYWWSNFHVKPSFQKRPFYIITYCFSFCKCWAVLIWVVSQLQYRKRFALLSIYLSR